MSSIITAPRADRAERPPAAEKIPHKLRALMNWRERLKKRVYNRRDVQAGMMEQCRDNILLFVNLYGWLYEARGKMDAPRAIPFATYAFQDWALLEIQEALHNQHNLYIDKSRDMGATWMCLYVFLHAWLFYPMVSFMLVSRNQKLVYDSENYDALFSKLEFALKRLPDWMRPAYHIRELHLGNLENGSTFDGEASTGNVGRGGRKSGALFDEYAAFDAEQPGSGRKARNAILPNTDSLTVNTTTLGQANEAFRLMTETDIPILVLDWKEHPRKNRGLYRAEGGHLLTLDKTYTFEPDYNFILDAKTRSPWYDYEERRGSPALMAQEVDRDHAAGGGLYFNTNVLNEVIARDVREPIHQGELGYKLNEKGKVELSGWRDEYGKRNTSLWFELRPDGTPPDDRNYVVAADVSHGNGASNSVICVADTTTRQKVAEFADSEILPEEFGRLFVAFCRFFRGPLGSAYGIWEANGPGGTTGNEIVKKQGYRRIYYRRHEDSSNPKDSDKYGWWSSAVSKNMLFGALRTAYGDDTFGNPSREALKETKRYILDTMGVPECPKVADAKTGARAGHGDRVVADALAVHALSLEPKAKPADLPPPLWSLAWREKQRATPVRIDEW